MLKVIHSNLSNINYNRYLNLAYIFYLIHSVLNIHSLLIFIKFISDYESKKECSRYKNHYDYRPYIYIYIYAFPLLFSLHPKHTNRKIVTNRSLILLKTWNSESSKKKRRETLKYSCRWNCCRYSGGKPIR